MNIRQARKIVRAVNDARMMLDPLRHNRGTALLAWEKLFRPKEPYWRFWDWWQEAVNGCQNVRCWNCRMRIIERVNQHFCSQDCFDTWIPF